MMSDISVSNGVNSKIDFLSEKFLLQNQHILNEMPIVATNQSNELNMMSSLINPALVTVMQQMEQFPDILQNFSYEQTRIALEYLIQSNNLAMINKPGVLGGYTALHWLSIKNEFDLIEYLLENSKVDVNCKAQMGETPLFIAIKNCNYLTIELLIKHGADLHVRDIYNRSIIHWIAYTGKVVIFYYFQKYHSITNLNDVDQFLQNPLHIACASGFSDLIVYLVESRQIDLFAQDANGNTCLHMAVKSGLPRICWKITQQNGGECIKLIDVLNNQNQRPIDLIKNEKGPNYKKLRDWLKLEAKTNKFIKPNQSDLTFDKKNDGIRNCNNRDSQLSSIKNLLSFDSNQQMKLEWQARFFSFPIVLLFPIVLQYYLFNEVELTLWRGFINYVGLFGLIILLSKQQHRISHISGLENPIHLGFFLVLWCHNYFTFFFQIMTSFNITRMYDFFTVLFGVCHTYLYYKVITGNQGVTHEHIKKPDGTPYELRDLMKINNREGVKYAKDSFSWLTQPSNVSGYSKAQMIPQAYFCESCQIIQAIPAKHCKLCEGCCLKFDHHCIFINRCVGLKNHRNFILFLIATMVCEFAFLEAIFVMFYHQAEELNLLNASKDAESQVSFFYLCFASRFHVRLIAVSIVNAFTTIMVFTLFLYQISFIALGYTSQFRPPILFEKAIKQMKTRRESILFRLNNFYTFCCRSYEENEKMYFRYQRDYYLNTPNQNEIPLGLNCDNGLYPRDNFGNHLVGAKNDEEKKHVEIALG